MENSTFKNFRKFKLLAVTALLPCVTGCAPNHPTEAAAPQKRFAGIGLVLVVDAVPGAEMEQVVMYDDLGWKIYSSAVVARRNRSIMAVGNGRVPSTVRVVWRTGAGWDNVRHVWNEGVIAGDYKISVAERIPDEVVRNIRRLSGNLRLKFRLKPDGVLFGWDIERSSPLGEVSVFEMPGGDFAETRY